MPRPRLPNLVYQRTRHGTIVWYHRIGHGARTRIRGAYMSPEFIAEYKTAALGEEPISKRAKTGPNTLQWLWERYHGSSAWASLSPATRRQRENIMRHVLDAAGQESLSVVSKAAIIEGRDRRRDTPSQANNFLDTMRALFSWALDNELNDVDPTIGVKNLKRPKTEGFHPWTEAEIAKFEAYWPVSSRERLAFAILLFTGLRRGDAVRLGKQHIRQCPEEASHGIISIKTEKTDTRVTMAIHEELHAIIKASSAVAGDLNLIATERGTPRVKESFGNWFKMACTAAGVPGSAHGLRKAAARRMAENGATVTELEAIFGWEGGQMASLYTREADRQHVGLRASNLIGRTRKRTSYSLTHLKVRELPS